VLRQHPAVRDAVALVHEGTTGDRHIVAYLVVKREPAPAVSELRSFLRAKLPEYMTPSAFMILAALPLTPNGKVDRNALLGLKGLRCEPKTRDVVPGNDLEKILTMIWREALSVGDIGLSDNFFDLGGHSLMATKVHNQMVEILQKDFPLSKIFEFPTIRSLS